MNANIDDLVEQDFKAEVVLFSTTEGKKKLTLTAEAWNEYRPLFTVYKNNKILVQYLTLSYAIEYFNAI